MSNLFPSAQAQLKEYGETGHSRPSCVHDRAADDHCHITGAQQRSLHQEVFAGPVCGPSAIEQYEERKGRRGNGEAPGDKREEGVLEKFDALCYVRHLISHPGNVLEQHHVVYEKQIFRAEQWLVFSTARPLSAMYKLKVIFHVHAGRISLSFFSLALLREYPCRVIFQVLR